MRSVEYAIVGWDDPIANAVADHNPASMRAREVMSLTKPRLGATPTVAPAAAIWLQSLREQGLA
jgi:hypothetical protein